MEIGDPTHVLKERLLPWAEQSTAQIRSASSLLMVLSQDWLC